MRRTYLVLPLIALALGVGACAPVKGPAPACPIPSAQEMVAAVNADRAPLPPVVLVPELTAIAQSWANHMAAVGTTRPWHSPDSHRAYTYRRASGGIVSGTAKENVGGPSVGCLDAHQWEATWMASAPHRDNILRTGWGSVGIGFAIDSQGRQWAVQEFGP